MARLGLKKSKSIAKKKKAGVKKSTCKTKTVRKPTEKKAPSKKSITAKAKAKAKPKGRPKKAVVKSTAKPKNTKKLKKDYVKKLEKEILSTVDIVEKNDKGNKTSLEQILFRLPIVAVPLVGTPKQVQPELDDLALKMQKKPDQDAIFDKIHLYMHGYLINVVLRKFPYIKGYQTVDIYQETLISLRFKAIPNFKKGKGMSFLNFSKMCIRRHLITLLNASRIRLKDQSLNRAISLDSSPLKDDSDDGKNSYFNVVADEGLPVDKLAENSEAYALTKGALYGALSDFERVVLEEYLSSSSYKEISKNVSKVLSKRYNTKSIDNALLRIRKKAMYLREHVRTEDLPLFML